jgi:hypothetical protein
MKAAVKGRVEVRILLILLRNFFRVFGVLRGYQFASVPIRTAILKSFVFLTTFWPISLYKALSYSVFHFAYLATTHRASDNLSLGRHYRGGLGKAISRLKFLPFSAI